jgi:rod shape determining protein RodA
LADERSDEVSYPRFLGGLILVSVPAVLIIVQPDLGSASVIVTIAMGVLLVAGAKPKYIATISILSISTVAAAFVGGLVNNYQQERFRESQHCPATCWARIFALACSRCCSGRSFRTSA